MRTREPHKWNLSWLAWPVLGKQFRHGHLQALSEGATTADRPGGNCPAASFPLHPCPRVSVGASWLALASVCIGLLQPWTGYYTFT